eukprot:TRINITY_DN9465_c0_g1_i1.p1 TRINITY_DN9465_c0_g1~~TRINITY_DN9465_c0_g1_i1.p1  ORF type:complete len:1271 (+),score=384.68 TRINITY_DN9465_c0_g1_i1:99-3815(+)
MEDSGGVLDLLEVQPLRFDDDQQKAPAPAPAGADGAGATRTSSVRSSVQTTHLPVGHTVSFRAETPAAAAVQPDYVPRAYAAAAERAVAAAAAGGAEGEGAQLQSQGSMQSLSRRMSIGRLLASSRHHQLHDTWNLNKMLEGTAKASHKGGDPASVGPDGDVELDEGTSDDEAHVSAGELVQVKALMQFLSTEIKQYYSVRHFPIFMVFLVLFTASVGFVYLTPDKRDGLRLTEAVSDNMLLSDQFRLITTPSDVYSWLTLALTNIWAHGVDGIIVNSTAAGREGVPLALPYGAPERRMAALRSGAAGAGSAGGTAATEQANSNLAAARAGGYYAARQNLPLHWLLLRQRRVASGPCSAYSEQSRPIREEERTVILRECFAGYSRSALNASYFRENASTPVPPHVVSTTDAFRANGEKDGAVPRLHHAQGKLLGSYSASDAEFTCALNYSLTIAQANEVVQDLKDNYWLDHATRFIVFETFTFNPEKGVYAHVLFSLEVSETGQAVPKPTMTQFWLLLHDTPQRTFAFAVDIISAAYCLWVLKECVWQIMTAVKTGQEPVGAWEVVSLAQFATLSLHLAYRFVLWTEAGDIGSGLPPVPLFERLADYQELFTQSRDWALAALWLTWIRVLEFLRYNKRLNSVSETIRLGADDLISLCVILFFVLLGFGLLGNGLYGENMHDFSTLGDSVAWLVRAMISSDMSQWDEMTELRPSWTPVYLLLFFVLSWLVLLNIVLGILAQGFSVASQAEEDWSWGLKSLRTDISNLGSQLMHSFSSADDDQGPDSPRAGGQLRAEDNEQGLGGGAGQQRQCCCIAWVTGGNFVSQRVECVKFLDEVIREKERLHHEREDTKVRTGLKEQWQRKVFHKADVEISYMTLVESEEWTLGKHASAVIFRGAKKMAGTSFAEAEHERRRQQHAMVDAVDRLSRRMRRQLIANSKELENSLCKQVDSTLVDFQEKQAEELAQHSDRILAGEERTQNLIDTVSGQLDTRTTAMLGSIQEAVEQLIGAVTALGDVTKSHLDEAASRHQGQVAGAKEALAAALQETRKESDSRILNVLADGEGRVRRDIATLGETVLDGGISPLAGAGPTAGFGSPLGGTARSGIAAAGAPRRAAELDLRERRLERKEAALKRKQEEVDGTMALLQSKEAEVARRAQEFERLTEAARRRDEALSRRAEALSARESGLGSPSAVASPWPRRGSPRAGSRAGEMADDPDAGRRLEHAEPPFPPGGPAVT